MEYLCKHLKSIKIPCPQDNVYKDECVYSYDTPVGMKLISFLRKI